MRLLLVLALCLASPGLARDLVGTARFGDGDTLHLDDLTIRLFGIDAPETEQTCATSEGQSWACGQWAAKAARGLFDGQRLTCAPRDIDRYGRIVATCRADGQDVGATLVAMGAAIAYRKYATDYVAAEKQAVIAGLGLWQGEFQPPEDFRAGQDAQLAAVNAPVAEGCAVKGNISSKGRIYHLPGQENYTDTVISPAKGERWFCSSDEAEAAGWRAARR